MRKVASVMKSREACFLFKSVHSDCVLFAEHRNMPVDDAITLITRSFDKYMLDRRERTEGLGAGAGRAAPPAPEGLGFLQPSPRIQHLLDLLADRRHLTASELTLIIDYLVDRRRQLESPGDISARSGFLKVLYFKTETLRCIAVVLSYSVSKWFLMFLCFYGPMWSDTNK